jgi:hypothetical protein
METVEPLEQASIGSVAKAPVSMCFSYDLYRPQLFESILPVIDAIEICPDEEITRSCWTCCCRALTRRCGC